MFLFWSISDNSEAQHFTYFHFCSLQRDDHSCWNFFVDLLRSILFGAFQMHLYCLAICCSDFVFQERSAFFADPEGRSVISLILDHDSDLLDAAGIMMDFFKQPRASVQIEATWSFWTFWVLFDRSGRFCLLLCLCIILTWNPIDYHCFHLLLVVHQRIYCLGISSLCL